ncbi:MAG TPA: YggT family protein [Ktedonobacterales bacterium]|nr:YggT family protein [Ktedonobacterales bacterium]
MLTPNISGLLHLTIDLFFRLLILALLVRVIVSWLPLPPGNPFTRFFTNLTDPILMPIAKRIPAGAVGFFDLSLIISLFFSWWALGLLDAIFLSALPSGW